MPVVTSQLQLGNNANFSGGSSGYLADAPKGTVIQQAVHNTGYGAGINYGIKFVRTEYTGWMHGDLQQNPSVLLNAKEMIFSKTNQEASQKLAFKGYRTGRALFENFFTAGVAILSSLLFFDFCI